MKLTCSCCRWDKATQDWWHHQTVDNSCRLEHCTRWNKKKICWKIFIKCSQLNCFMPIATHCWLIGLQSMVCQSMWLVDKLHLPQRLIFYDDIHLQTAPLLMILPSSALHLPQLLAGSGVQAPPADTLVTPFLLRADNSARRRLKQKIYN